MGREVNHSGKRALRSNAGVRRTNDAIHESDYDGAILNFYRECIGWCRNSDWVAEA